MNTDEIKELVLWMKENGVKSFSLPGQIAVTFEGRKEDRTGGFVPAHLTITDEEDLFNVR